MKLKQYQNMTYVKLPGVHLPAEVTNVRTHGLADDLI
jgi:hypothetical protein